MAKRASKLAKKAKKKGLAPRKMNNIRNLKRIKNREFTPAERKARIEARREKKKQTYAELRARKYKEMMNLKQFENEEEIYPISAEVTGEEMMTMIDADDLSYLVEHNKDAQPEEEKPKDENEEKPYETEERSFHPMGNDLKPLLPFKTKTGIIERYTRREEDEDDKDRSKKAKSEEQQAEVPDVSGDEAVENKKEEPETKSVIELMAERQEKLERKKVSIGCLSVNFLEAPEQRLHCLSNLIHMLEENDPGICYTVRKYVAVSLLEVFHKTIPSYHIEPHDLTQKLKKVTKEQYLYENLILKSYQTYLKELERFLKEYSNAKRKTYPAKQLAMVALRCMGDLLIKHTHFTYTNNIIAALLPYLNHREDDMCQMVVQYFKTLFKDDIKGDVSLEAVKRIDHFIRRRTYNVRIECLSVLLFLRIKNVKSLDEEMEAKNVAKKKLTHTEKLMRKLMEEKKPKKSNKEAKRYRKFRKLEEERKEQKLQQQQEVRSSQHTQIIEILFGLYFHVLKRRPNNKLNGIVLEGLAKFSHLVNIEFFSDLLNVLGGLMEEGTLKFRESLHCIQTVVTILSDQGEVLTIDPRRFYSYLYANLFKLSNSDNQEDLKSAMQSLMQMLVLRRKRVSIARVNSFIKRLATLSLSLIHNGAVSALATARYIMLTHPVSEVLLEVDSEGASGVFNPEVEEPEHCNASASALWELHLLNHHYHTTVRKFAEHLVVGAPLQGDKQLPPNLGKRRVEDIYDDFDPSMMRFNPAIPSPSQYLTKKMHSEARSNAKKQKVNQWSTQYMSREVEDVFKGCENPFNVQPSANPKKPNGVNKNTEALDKVNYFKGVLPNMNLSKIKIAELPEDEDEDVTLSLVNVDTEA